MLIDARGLSVNIGGNSILEGLDFSVSSGEFISILGPNGSGKTTLLRALMGIVPVGYERLTVKNMDARSLSRRKLARIMGYLPQMHGGLVSVAVMDFLLYSRFPYKGVLEPYDDEDRRAVNEAMMKLDCERLARRQMDTLSGGEFQRVMIASALAQETELILLDEPTAFLDPNHRQETFEILDRLNGESGKTIIMVTHSADYALNFSSRIMGLKEGHLAFDGTPEAFMNKSTAKELYGDAITINEMDGTYVIFPGGRR